VLFRGIPDIPVSRLGKFATACLLIGLPSFLLAAIDWGGAGVFGGDRLGLHRWSGLVTYWSPGCSTGAGGRARAAAGRPARVAGVAPRAGGGASLEGLREVSRPAGSSNPVQSAALTGDTVMTDPAEALGLRIDGDDYRPPPPVSAGASPTPGTSSVGLTAVGALLVGFLIATGITTGAAPRAPGRPQRRARRADQHPPGPRRRADGPARDLRADLAAAEAEVGGPGTGLRSSGRPGRAARRSDERAGPGLRVTFDDAGSSCRGAQQQDCRIQDADLQLAVNTLFGADAEAVADQRRAGHRHDGDPRRGAGHPRELPGAEPAVPVEAVGDPERLARRLPRDDFARDFEVWTEPYGLGFSEAVDDLELPAYGGSLRLPQRAVVTPGGRRDPPARPARRRDPRPDPAADRARRRCCRTCPSPSSRPLDAIFGAVRARLEGTFSERVFLVSFLTNVVLAVFLVYLGDQLGVGSELSTAVVVVLGVRIFSNLAAVRRVIFRA
jgi:hypothetical protein